MAEFDVATYPLLAGQNGLIEAGAGSGKTTALENLVVRLLLEGIVLPDGSRRAVTLQEMLVVTFTEAATAELILRVRDKIATVYRRLRRGLDDASAASDLPEYVLALLGRDDEASSQTVQRLTRQLRLALLSFDEATISTIHGFCYRMLNEFAFESGVRFDLELIGDDTELLQEAADDFWRANFYGTDNRFAAIAAAAVGLEPGMLPKIFRLSRKYPDFDFTDVTRDLSLSAVTDRLRQSCSTLLDYWTRNNLHQWFSDACGNFTKNADMTPSRFAGLHPENEPHERQMTALQIAGALTRLPGSIRKRLARSWPDGSKLDDDGVTPRHVAGLAEIATEVGVFMRRFRAAVQMEFVAKANAVAMLTGKKQAQGVQSFDDLLLDMYKAVESSQEFPGKIRHRFPVALIDEFQDTDPVQFDIFRKIFNHRESLMIMVGDPKQSIYAFRGADIFSYLRVANELPAERKSTLNRNYRSSPRLIEAVNLIFNRENPFVNEQIRFLPAVAGRTPERLVIDGDDVEQRPFQIWEMKDDEDRTLSKSAASDMACRATARKIATILELAQRKETGGERTLARYESPDGQDWRPVRAGDIAVLTDTKAEAAAVCQALGAMKVPAALQRTGNVFESGTAVEFYHVLNAISSPGNMRLVKTALTTPLFRFTLRDVERLDEGDEAAVWQERFSRLLQVWHERGFIQMFFRLLRPESVPEYPASELARKDIRCNLLTLPDGERRLTDLLHLGELLHQEARSRRLGVTALLALLRRRIQHPEENEAYERRLETDDEAVKVMTVHKSKGLQFGLVFCPFLWSRNFDRGLRDDGFFYHRPAGSGYELRFNIDCVPEAEALRQYRREELGELIRLAYVALTRAKDYCCMVWGNINGLEKTAPGYLAGDYGSDELDDLLGGGKADLSLANFMRWKQSPVIKCGIPCLEPVQYRHERKPPEIVVPELDRVFQDSWRIMSFSALTAHSDSEHHVEFELDDEPETSGEMVVVETAEDVPALSADFPGGTVTGNCIHQIFENLDFRTVKQPDWHRAPAVRGMIGDTLEAFGRIDVAPDSPAYAAVRDKRIDQICAMLDKVLNTPLLSDSGADCFRLADVPPKSTVVEMEFFFPVPRQLDNSRLNQVIEAFSGVPGNLEPGDSDALLRGMMTGKIDLLMEQNEQFYIVDWKTNLLGNTGSCYAAPEIERCMTASNYVLQAAIYTLALHRYLSRRKQDYRFATHFGGVYYLFVRGMNGLSAENGVWFRHPSQETMQMLEKVFGADSLSSS